MKPLPLREVVVVPEAVRGGLARLLTHVSPPHALLLVGAEGVGKRTLARSLAAAWLCLNRTPQGHCQSCVACQKWSESGEHPDVCVLKPEPDQIKIDSVRAVRQWAAFAPAVAPFRFVIVEEAHKLNPAAANALLKTLEEPPERYHFILTAPASDLLLPTILSRCRIVRLGVLSTDAVYHQLRARFELPEAPLRMLAEFSGGALGRALRWAQTLQTPESTSKSKGTELDALQQLVGVFERLGQASLEEALCLAHEFREACKALEASAEERSARAALALGLEYLLLWYRDSLALDYPSASLRFASHRQALSQLAQRFAPMERLCDLMAIAEARRAILGNANAQIVTEHLFIQLLGV
ncbi:MAG: DNA polymerase III subunit delta' [Armatimonadota bacterium]|nr:DNA polymerase III subunit delta' [Armatimonadota bacterium]